MQQKQLIAIILVIAVVAAAAVGAVLLLKGGSSGDTKYTVTYNTNGGNEIAAKEFTKNTDTFDLATPTKDGSSFLGWYLNADFSGDKITQIAKGTEKNITVYAKWQLNLANNTLPSAAQITANTDVKVTFDSGASDKTISNDILDELKAGKTLTIEDTVSKVSWTFDGAASKDIEYAAESLNTTITVTETATQVNPQATLSFTHSGKLPYPSTVKYFFGTDFVGQSVTVKNGSTLEVLGPFTVDSEGYVEFEIDHCSPWTITVSYNVTFDANGGQIDGAGTKTIVVAHNDTVGELPVPSRTGYDVYAWDPVANANDVITAAKTYTAQWTANSYTVKYYKNAEDATGSVDDQPLQYGNLAALSSGAGLARQGYTLSGWNTAADGSGTAYDLAGNVSNLTAVNNGTFNLYAQWTVNQYPATAIIGENAIRSNVPAGWTNNNNGSFTKNFNYGTSADDIIADFGSNAENTTLTGHTFNGMAPSQPTLGTTEMGIYTLWNPNAYTVRFNANGASGTMSDQAFVYGTSQNLTANAFTHNNAAFNGWATSATGTVVYADQAFVKDLTAENNAVIDLFAIWGPYNIVVNVTKDGAAYEGLAVTAKKDDAGNSLTLTYEGNGNYACRSGIELSSSYTVYIGTQNVGLVQTSAQGSGSSSVEYFTVTFDANGGVPVDAIVVALSGSTVDEPQDDFQKTGNELTGWKKGNVDWDFSTAITETTTLVAQWTPITYTIAYNNNGGTGTLPLENATYGIAIPASRPGEAIANEGYTFVNWNTVADGSGTSFAPGDNLLNLTTVQGATVTLYAQWAPITYYVVYNPNGGTGEIPQMTMTYGVAAQLAAGSFGREGYSFANWNTAANGSGTPYAAQQSVQNLTTVQGATVSLFAQWTPVQYTATFHPNGGNDVEPINFTVVSGDVALPGTLRNGYAFQGWFDNANLTGNVYTMIASGTIGDKDFYAKWGSNNATVQTKLNGTLYTFPGDITLWNNTNSATMTVRGTGDYYLETSEDFRITNGDTLTVKRGNEEIGTMTISDGIGTLTVNYYRVYFKINNDVYEEQAVRSGDVPVRPDDPTLPGRTFSKWTNADNSDFDFTEAITSSVTAYAKFTANPYTVTFADDRGTITTLNVHYGDDIEAVQVPQRDGFNFEGYFLENDQYFDASGNPMPTKIAWMMTDNITLTAHWGAKSITLDFRNEGPSLTATYGQAMPALSNTYLPVPGTGYEFTGYFDAAEGGKKYYNADLSSAVQTCDLVQNTVMYAQYAKITYTLVYVLNGGTGNVPVGTQVQIGDVVEQPASNPSRNGYTFAAWSLTDGVETTYFDQGVHTIGSADILLSDDSNLRVYALWTGNQYTVQYNANGGTGDAPQTSTVRAGATFVLPEFNTTKTVGNDRFFFAGWNTAADGTGDVCRGSEVFNDAFIALADNENVVTLYVNWAAMEFTPAVGYTFVGKQINGPNEQYDRTMIVIAVSAISYRVEEDTGFELHTYEYPIGSYPIMEYWCTNELIDTIITEQNRTGTDTVTINGVQKTVDVYSGRGTIGNNPYDITMKVTADGFICVMTTVSVSNGATTTYQYLTHEQRNYQAAEVTYNPYGGTPSGEQVRTDSTYQSAEQLGISRAGYRFLGWDNNFATFKPGDLVTKSRSVYASWQQITNPRTNIDWTVYNQPEGIALLIGENDAFGQNGVQGEFVTVSGGTDWSYSQNVFTFNLDGVTYHAVITDGDTDHVTALNDNGRFKIRFDEPAEGSYTCAYEIEISFYTDLPTRGRYVPTVDDTFVYNDGESNETYRVTSSVVAGQYTFVNSYGSSMYRLNGQYPQYYNTFYPDGDEDRYTWTYGTVVFNQQTIDCYVMTCKQFRQYYVSPSSQQLSDYNVYTLYIGVEDGLCYRAIEGSDDTDSQGRTTVSYTTNTLTSKPANMNYIATYHVTMQFNGGTYNGQQSAVSDLTGPSTTIIPQKDNYDFVGWSLTQGGAVRYAYSQGTFTPSNFLPADATQGSITLYAVWELTPVRQYTLSYVLVNSHIQGMDQTFTADDESVTLKTTQQLGIESRIYKAKYYMDASQVWYWPGDSVAVSELLQHVDEYDEVSIQLWYADTITVRINGDYHDSGYMSWYIENDGQSHNLPTQADVEDHFDRETYGATALYAQSGESGRQFALGASLSMADLMSIYNGSDYNLYVGWEELVIAQLIVHANNEGDDYDDSYNIAVNRPYPIPEFADLPWHWNNGDLVAVGMSLSEDGSNPIEFGMTISAEALTAAVTEGCVHLYFVWANDAVRGIIYANFNGANPGYVSAIVRQGQTLNLPSAEELANMWDYDGTPLGYALAADGQVQYGLGAALTYQQICDIDENSLYIIWSVQYTIMYYLIDAQAVEHFHSSETFMSTDETHTLISAPNGYEEAFISDADGSAQFSFGDEVSVETLIGLADSNFINFYIVDPSLFT